MAVRPVSVIVVIGLDGALGEVAECAAEEVDGVALEAEAEADVGVHRGSDADVGVAQQLLDGDEFDALLQEQRRSRVPQAVEADRPQAGAAQQRVEAPCEGGGFDGGGCPGG